MKLGMKVFKWITSNLDMIASAFWAGIAVFIWNAASVIPLLMAGYAMMCHLHAKMAERNDALIDALFLISSSQLECIDELTANLIPLIGRDAALEILKRHGVKWIKAWKDYDDKYPRGPRKPRTDRVKTDLSPAEAGSS